MRRTTSEDLRPLSPSDSQVTFAANLPTGRSAFACAAAGVAAVLLVGIGVLGPRGAGPLHNIAASQAMPRLTESAVSDLRSIAEARALVDTRGAPRLTESAVSDLRSIAEVRALVDTP